MAKQLLREYYELCPDGICRIDYLNEAEQKSLTRGGKYLTGVCQRAGVKNGNGRIYPRPVLEREVEKYQAAIKNRTASACGECVPPETEILTKNGWRSIVDVQVDDEIFTLNLENENIELQKVTHKIDKPYSGPMYHIHNNSSIDMRVTPDHKLVVWGRYGKVKKITASEYKQAFDTKIRSGDYFKHGGVWNSGIADIPDEITKLGFTPQQWAAFLGFYIAEGHFVKGRSAGSTGTACITQKNEPTRQQFRQLITESGIKFSEYVNKDNTSHFYFRNREIYEQVAPLGHSYQKHIPEYAKNWKPELLNHFLTWYLKGDGKNRKNPTGVLLREAGTVSKQLADDLCEVFLKVGAFSGHNVRIQPDTSIHGRIIKAENCRPLHLVSEHTTKGSHLDKRFVRFDTEDYSGRVYCVTVPNGTWLMRYNGRVAWTSNCDHPDTQIISLKEASHICTGLWWEGNDLIGKFEVLPTPNGNILKGYIDSHIKLGVSSRALGSLRETREGAIVEDDLQLICFDIVSEPSTAGAFILPDNGLAETLKKKPFHPTSNINDLIESILRG